MDTVKQLARKLTAERKKAGNPSWRTIEKRLVMQSLKERAPSYETIRAYHEGRVSDDRLNVEIIAALAEMYGTTLKDLCPPVAERVEALRDLLDRVAGCIPVLAA